MSPAALSPSDPLRGAAESFVKRLRKGERPTLAEYTERYPDQATRIREIFPRILASERRAGEEQTTGPFGLVESGQSVPKAIGDYLIVREIGRGGMGIVYEAVQASLGRQVALKVLPSGPCSRGPFLERFKREARAAARLHHTNIVPVFGVGEAEGVHFYAMQYIEGMGLDAVLKEVRNRRGLVVNELAEATKTVNLMTRNEVGPALADDFELGPASILPQADADPATELPFQDKCLKDLADMQGPRYYRSIARLGVQAAEALAYAHAQGVLHRDVKPSNLLLDRYGILWITDFGLAKAEGEDLTGTGDIVGTLRYMAPERFQGESNGRSDIYALGMTLYEMLTLRPAFEEDDRLRLVQRITHDKPKRPRQVDRGIPLDLETIVLKCIQKEPDHRYATAAEAADDLRRLLTDRPIKARRASLFEELRRWCRRNPSVTGLIGLSMMAWVLVIAVIITSWNISRNEQSETRRQAMFAETATTTARDNLRQSLVGTAQLRRPSIRKVFVGQRFDALEALVKAREIREGLDLTTNAIASLALPDWRQRHGWDGFPKGSHQLDFDGSFERYARSERDGAVSIRDVASDAEITRLPGFGGPSLPRYGRGELLGVLHERGGRLQVWRYSKQNPEAAGNLVLDVPANVMEFDFAPDEQSAAALLVDGTLAVYRLPAPTPAVAVRVEGRVGGVAYHPQRQSIAVATERGIVCLHPDSGAELHRVELAGAARVAWHPDGERLAVGTADGQVHVFRRPGGGPQFSFETVPGGLSALFFHPSGDWLVCVGDRKLRVYDPFTGRPLLSAPWETATPRFSADGTTLGPNVTESRVTVFEVATGRECRTLVRRSAATQSPLRDCAVSPDRRLAAVATGEGVILWDLATGEEMTRLPTGPAGGCLFLPDGHLLTGADSGILEWPVVTDPLRRVCRIGPPRQLLDGPCERLACSKNGSVIAAVTRQGATVVVRDRPAVPSLPLAHEGAAYVSVDPAGRWIVTATREGGTARVWGAADNRLLREIPVQRGSSAVFSPGGQWLVTFAEGPYVQLWNCQSANPKQWIIQQQLPADRRSPLAFSPDGSLLAVESGNGSLYVYERERGELVAELPDPSSDRATTIAFAPDGYRVLAASNDSQSVRVWDLNALRAGLVKYNLVESGTRLDGKVLPTNCPEPPPALRSLEVIGTTLTDPTRQAWWASAVATAFAALNPNDPDTFCRRAAALSKLGFDDLALADLTHALRLRPDHPEASLARGMELYRRRNWKEAMADFGRAGGRPGVGDMARLMRGKSLLQLDRVEDMMAEVNTLIERYPSDPQLYYQRALGHSYRGRYEAALADLNAALAHGASHDPTLNNLAWLLATGPPHLRDLDRALGCAKKAAGLAPDRPTYHNTLGVVLYRLGRFRDAAEALQFSVARGKGQSDGYNYYVLAMCQVRLNEHAAAQASFDLAQQWQRRRTLTVHEAAELDNFQREAREVFAEVGITSVGESAGP